MNRLCGIVAVVTFVVGVIYVWHVATLDDTTKTIWGLAFGGLSLTALAAVL